MYYYLHIRVLDPNYSEKTAMMSSTPLESSQQGAGGRCINTKHINECINIPWVVKAFAHFQMFFKPQSLWITQ